MFWNTASAPMSRTTVKGAALGLILLMLLGCAPGKRPFLMVQMCLSDQGGVTTFVEEMRSIATSQRMEFLDNSADTARGLDAVGYTGRERNDGSPVINLGIQQKDGKGAFAGNQGLPGYQVAIGFSEGSKPDEAREFAALVVKRLEQRWPVQVVPDGKGAMPLEGCQ
jgi:hypothetical protein